MLCKPPTFRACSRRDVYTVAVIYIVNCGSGYVDIPQGLQHIGLQWPAAHYDLHSSPSSIRGSLIAAVA